MNSITFERSNCRSIGRSSYNIVLNIKPSCSVSRIGQRDSNLAVVKELILRERNLAWFNSNRPCDTANSSVQFTVKRCCDQAAFGVVLEQVLDDYSVDYSVS